MPVRLPRLVPAGLLALIGVVALVSGAPATTAVVPAADTSAFQAGNIISDAVFYDSGSMSAAAIQSFLNAKGASCVAGPDAACIKNYAMATSTQPADSFCPGGYTGAASESAAQIIAKVATACGISPRVLLVTVQKEQALITTTAPTAHAYDRAMGYGCPDSANGGCSAYYPGLFKQLYFAAKQFKRYAANPTGYSFVPGMTNTIAWSPRSSCGAGPVLIQNQATAGLYNYTPYQPNQAALAAGYGSSSDACASYGNRNFWMYFTDWFGSTQTLGRDLDAPVGTVDSATGGPGTVTVNGWAYDPNALTTSITVHVYVDGTFATALTANAARPDVGAAYPGVGPSHGYTGSVAADPGARTVCVYGINIGAGATNPLLGCSSVTVGAPPNPIGNVDSVTASGRTLSVAGWTFDPDVPTTPVSVHLYVNGQWTAAVTADGARPDVGLAYTGVGTAHGFTWSTRVSAPGDYTVCAYGINQGAGTTNPLLACGTATVSGETWNPTGSLDSITVSGRTASMGGWALDGDTPTTPTAVHVYVDGQWGGAFTADAARPDVGAAFPGTGAAHGFAISMDVPGGTHQLCLYLINTGYGSTNPLLTCRTVTVDPATWNPSGSLDSAVVSGGAVTVNGWVIDPDAPQSPVVVHTYVDGAWGGLTTANASRPDVAAAYPAAGAAHGYSLSVPVGSGRHTVCTYAINVGQGTTNPLIACRVVG
jgi:uncharacterized membrane protein